MEFNYPKICQGLLCTLPQRTRDIVKNRFGLDGGGRKTLEAIGKNYGISRERVRQIENEAISEIRPGLKELHKVFQHFEEELRLSGNFRREDKFIGAVAGDSGAQNHAFFLLNLNENFKRGNQNEDFHSFWAIDYESLNPAKEAINLFCQKLSEINRPIALDDFKLPQGHPWSDLAENSAKKYLNSAVEISRKIEPGLEGLFGFKIWPEINPKNIRDKIYLVLKSNKKPLHFRQLTDLIGKYFAKSALCQTVHNELIRDRRFVLVGRGTYALRDWGYEDGYVKDVILNILKEVKRPLTKEEILEKVLSRRLVKKSTVLFNLWNKKYFTKDADGKYTSNID